MRRFLTCMHLHVNMESYATESTHPMSRIDLVLLIGSEASESRSPKYFDSAW